MELLIHAECLKLSGNCPVKNLGHVCDVSAVKSWWISFTSRPLELPDAKVGKWGNGNSQWKHRKSTIYIHVHIYIYTHNWTIYLYICRYVRYKYIHLYVHVRVKWIWSEMMLFCWEFEAAETKHQNISGALFVLGGNSQRTVLFTRSPGNDRWYMPSRCFLVLSPR